MEQGLGSLGPLLLLLGLWADQIAHQAPDVDPTRSLLGFPFPSPLVSESRLLFLFFMPFGGSG